MKSMAIIVRDDSFDKIMVPLAFAHAQAQQGCQVEVLFTSWSVNILKQGGHAEFKIQSAHADATVWFSQQIEKLGFPSDLYALIKVLLGTNKVNLYACNLGATVFGVNADSLIPELSPQHIVDAVWFLNEKAQTAEHCAYF